MAQNSQETASSLRFASFFGTPFTSDLNIAVRPIYDGTVAKAAIAFPARQLTSTKMEVIKWPSVSSAANNFEEVDS